MNELIDKLLPLEEGVFLALNRAGSPFWDDAMWTYTGIITWMPMALFIIYILLRNQQLKEGILILGCIALVLIFSHLLSASFFKPLFKRHRPTHHHDYMNIVNIVNGFRGAPYGFISGHATNSFGLAVFFALLFRNRLVTISMLFWAALNSYSRIYLGVHFISDIVAGLIFGSLVGFLIYQLYVWIRLHFFEVATVKKKKSIYSKKSGNILAVGIILYIAFVILFSPFLTYISHSIIPASWF